LGIGQGQHNKETKNQKKDKKKVGCPTSVCSIVSSKPVISANCSSLRVLLRSAIPNYDFTNGE
jgi:hypothetical protein